MGTIEDVRNLVRDAFAHPNRTVHIFSFASHISEQHVKAAVRSVLGQDAKITIARRKDGLNVVVSVNHT